MNISAVYGVVYLITNLINGKVYVGQTVGALKKRLRNHYSHAIGFPSGKYKGKDTPLFRSMRKYGKESFSISLVCSCSAKEELDLMEDLYIVLLGGFSKKKGYNIRRGGGNGKMSEEVKAYCGSLHRGRKHTTEARKKMSDAIKKSLALKPRVFSPETRKKMSLSRKGKPHHWSEEAKLHMSQRFSGEGGTSYKPEASTELMVHLYSQNYSSLDISRVVPLSPEGIQHRIKKAGVAVRKPTRYLPKPCLIEEYMEHYRLPPGLRNAGP